MPTSDLLLLWEKLENSAPRVEIQPAPFSTPGGCGPRDAVDAAAPGHQPLVDKVPQQSQNTQRYPHVPLEDIGNHGGSPLAALCRGCRTGTHTLRELLVSAAAPKFPGTGGHAHPAPQVGTTATEGSPGASVG